MNDTLDIPEEFLQDEGVELDETSAEFVDSLVKRLILFIQEFCDVTFFPYQVPIAYGIVESIVLGDGEEKTLIATRQSGKSEVVSNIVAGLMVILPKLSDVYPTWLGKFKKGFLCGIFAPVEDQADTVFGRVVSKLTSDHAMDFLLDPELNDKATSGGARGKGKVIHLKNSGSLCRMQSCNPKAKIESKTYHFIFVDEAQQADEQMITKCVAAGTPVWTPDGNALPVEQVVLEQLPIMSYSKSWDLREGIGRQVHNRDRTIGDLVPTTPSEWHDNGVKPVWRVTTSSGRYVDATANHRWVVRERKGNSLPKERQTSELRVGMSLPLTLDGDPGPHGTGTLDEGYFSGQIIGDGCTAQQVQWCGHRDGALSEMVRIAESWGDTFSVYKENPDNGLVEGAFIGGASKALLTHYNLMHKIGVDKALSTSGHSSDFYRGLVAGLWDSDGYVDSGTAKRNGAAYYASISETLIRQVQYVLQRLGILATLSVRDNSNSGYSSTNPLWTLCVKDVESLKQFHSVIKLHTEYKQAALEALVRNTDGRVGRRHPRISHPKRAFGEGRIAWDRIVSVEYVGERPTFCVTVEPSNAVIWNGFVGLNSIKPMLAFNNGTIVLGGTAQREKSYFYKMIQYNKRRDVASNRGHKQAHYEYDYRIASRYNDNYAKFIRKEKLRLGEDSDEFRMSYCPEISTPILTADLVYIQAGEVTPGMKLVGFDEERPGKGQHRRFRESVVIDAEELTMECSRIELSDGSSVVCTPDHQWLVLTAGSRTVWKRTDELADTDTLHRIASVWWMPGTRSYETGYLAAAFDGEGSLNIVDGRLRNITFAQRDNAMLAEVKRCLDVLGFRYQTYSYEGYGTNGDVIALHLRGGRDECMRFLGTVRPLRLLDLHSAELWGTIGRHDYNGEMDHPKVVSVTPVGERQVMAIKTTTGTYIADGLASHNCNEWILEKGMFVSEERLDSLYHPRMKIVQQWWDSPIVVGIDVARSNDSTVVTPVWVDWDHPDGFGFYEHRVLNWLEINNVEWEQQYFDIINFLRNYEVYRVGVDSQGVGGPIAERLQILMPNVDVVAVSSDAKAQNERWTHLTQLIQRGQLIVPGDSRSRAKKVWKRFNQQMGDLEKVNRGPYMLAAAPEERNAFDDYPDSLAIACALTIDDTLPTVQVYDNPFFG